MFQLDKTLVSESIIDNDFVCNISACKGECCIAGDAGAPLEESEVNILKSIYPKVKPFMRPEGIAAVNEQGTSIITATGDLETPLVKGKECAYVSFNNKGTALCAIEQAYNAEEVDFKKPISCHLYPVRTKNYTEFTAVNYEKWDICNDACTLGKSLKVPVYAFVKEALIRKFGKNWYTELELIATEQKK